MAADLILAPEAELDVIEAYAWYEDRRAGLGEEFLNSVDACMESIRRQPAIYAVVHETYRRALVRRFPYAIFFESSDARITVYAVSHTARDPRAWHRRLP